MTSLFAIISGVCGVVILFMLAEREVDKIALEQLREANRALESRNKDLETRLKQYRGNYRPLRGDFGRLHAIKGGRDG